MKDFEFLKIELPFEDNLFEILSNSVEFKKTGKGRLGNHLVDVTEKGIPIVRTTTEYDIAAGNFLKKHHTIISEINNQIQESDLNLPELFFNNALIEVYESKYKKMKYHSDQSLDLDSESYIALFSCYENPEKLNENTFRKLKIKDKITEEESEIVLSHNSVVLFSTLTNKQFYHKIVLETMSNNEENKWLGITFRKSKTFITIKNDTAYFENGELLQLATEQEKRSFFMLRGEENRSLNFMYPTLKYTISKGDLIQPKLK